MAQQQDGLPAAFAGEVHLKMIARVLLPMQFHASAELAEFVGEHRTELVAGDFVMRRRFEQHEFFEGGHHLGFPWRQPIAHL
jgi:hypothetical protein